MSGNKVPAGLEPVGRRIWFPPPDPRMTLAALGPTNVRVQGSETKHVNPAIEDTKRTNKFPLSLSILIKPSSFLSPAKTGPISIHSLCLQTMPTLDEISYDREATIAAVRDFYEFLTKMFLPESWIIYPPPEGWPSITNERMRPLGKTDEVIELMRRLPYLHVDAKVAPDTAFADWQSGIDPGELDEGAADGIRTITEGADYEDIPASAFGLTCGGRNTMAMVLDTRFGIVHWEDCPVSSSKAIREPVDDDFDDCTPENEHIWRSNTAWTIPDFFEVLKNEYRVLNYVPLHEGQVDEWVKDGDGDDDADANQSGRGVMLRSVKRVYREHGWPDLSVYSKDECLKAVEKLIRDRFPDEAWIFGH